MGWQVGDLALCIKMGPWVTHFASGKSRPSTGPRPGQILTVTHVGVGVVFNVVLQFKECCHGDTNGFNAIRFRKVTPDAKIEGVEVERRVPVKTEQLS